MYPGRDSVSGTSVWPESVLDTLRRLGKDLARSMHRWEEFEAAWFVLTGVTPVASPLEAEVAYGPGAEIRGREKSSIPPTGDSFVDELHLEDELAPSAATITLNIEPWVPAERVKKFYRRVQKKLTGNAKPSWERNLRVYVFVKQRRSEGIDDSRLPVLWDNTAREQWRYRAPHGFWQAYGAARRQVEETLYEKLED